MVQLGYAEPSARAHLTWALTRILLHRGDPDIEAITGADVFELAEAVRAYGARDDFVVLRAAMHPRVPVQNGAAERYIKNHLNKVHPIHVLLFNIGQVAEPPTWGTVPKVADWSDRLLPEPCPPRIRTVVERYLRLRLVPSLIDRKRCVYHEKAFADSSTGSAPRTLTLRICRASTEVSPKNICSGCLPISARTPANRWQSRLSNMRSMRLAAFFRDTAVWGWT